MWILCSKRETHFLHYSHCYSMWRSFTTGIVASDSLSSKGCERHDQQPNSTEILVFKCSISNSTTIKHFYNESAKLMESYVVHFDIKGPWNLTEMASVIGVEDMVSHACLCYTPVIGVEDMVSHACLCYTPVIGVEDMVSHACLCYTPVIGVEDMVSHACLCYTQDCLTLAICSLIKPTAMEKMMSFHAKINTIMLW